MIHGHVKSFTDFLNEGYMKDLIKNYSKKVAWILQISDITSTSGNGITKRQREYNEEARDMLFNCYATKEQYNDKSVTVPSGMPILYYGSGTDRKSELFLKNKSVDSKYLYNQPELLSLSGDKIEFAKVFKKFNWLPKTVFSKKEAIEGAVGFPVVAKIKDGHSGIGIQKFDTAKELQDSKETFDLYCQFIDFDREYRVAFCKEKIFLINERVPTIKDDSSIRTKKANENISFTYVCQDLNKVDPAFIKKVKDICSEIKTELDLGLWSLDVVVDKNGKLWVMETSAATGLGSTKICEVYKAIYEDFYKEPLPDKFLEELYLRFVVTGQQNYWPKMKKEILSSEWAMDYTILTNPKAENGYRYFFNLKKQ